jgi:integrase
VGDGRYVDPSGKTIRDYLLGEWLPSRLNADIAPGTREYEQLMTEAYLLPHIGDIPLQRLKPRDIDRLYATLRARGGRGGKPLRGKTVRNAAFVLSGALNDAVKRRHIAVNPVSLVTIPAADDSQERAAWTLEELHTFLEVAAGDRLGAIWRLALATGLRRGELIGLQWPDVEGASVTVARQVLLHPRPVAGWDRAVFVRPFTKTRKRRRVRFDQHTAAALAGWKKQQAADRLLFGRRWLIDGGIGVEAAWMVTEPDGSVLHPETFSDRWSRLVRAAGVSPIGLHGARHTYAEMSLRAGVRLDVLSRQLGHASILTTAANYLHDDEDSARTAAELVGGLLGEHGHGNGEWTGNGGSEALGAH